LEQFTVEYLPTLATIAGVFLLGCLSPGPNFLVVTARAIAVSRRAGVFAGLGVASASLTWAFLTIIGLTFVLQHAAWLFTALRFVGAAYLLYLGARTIIGAHRPVPLPPSGRGHPSVSNDVWSGFLTSMTNPKAAAFFGSLFVVTLPTNAPVWVYGVTLAIVAVLSTAWHCSLALFFSLRSVQSVYRRSRKTISTAMGGVLILLGVRLLVAR
jgi:threonine efflux protein